IGCSWYPVPCHKKSMLGDAKRCLNLPATKSQKPAITQAPGHFLLDRARQRRTRNHSHSIIDKPPEPAWLKEFVVIAMEPYRHFYRQSRRAFADAGDRLICGAK